jgi:hypothetical protein
MLQTAIEYDAKADTLAPSEKPGATVGRGTQQREPALVRLPFGT